MRPQQMILSSAVAWSGRGALTSDVEHTQVVRHKIGSRPDTLPTKIAERKAGSSTRSGTTAPGKQSELRISVCRADGCRCSGGAGPGGGLDPHRAVIRLSLRTRRWTAHQTWRPGLP